MENNNQSFEYTYSPKQQEEIQRIRKKYLPQEENKMEQLLRLDKSVSQKATTVSLIVGILGTLILGVGMCCTMVWEQVWFIPGIFIGILGIAILALAYPLHQRVISKERAKIAPQIIRLTDELMK